MGGVVEEDGVVEGEEEGESGLHVGIGVVGDDEGLEGEAETGTLCAIPKVNF